MSQAATKPSTKPRTATKQERKTQLIKATIRSIAKHGLSVTTMATVSREAGLSQGIINLHFQSKERLLEETLCFVVDEYRTVWYEALEGSEDSAAKKLQALVGVGFDKRVCQRNKLAVWFAFWGESSSRPTYRKICAARDREYKLVLAELCEEIIEEGGYKARADFVAHGLAALSEGLWLDLLLIPPDVNLERAKAVTFAYLQDVFPGHFPNHSG